MRKFIFILLAGLTTALPGGVLAQDGSDMNALMIVDSDSAAFNKDFQKYLADNGARIIHAYAPHAFIGYVPTALDAALGKDYRTAVYRVRIDDMSVAAKYGENVFFAINIWNKHFVEDPPEAPLVISYKVQQVKKGAAIVLSWNEVMKASEYKLQISPDTDFKTIMLETVLSRNRYEVIPAFFPDGVYYWRVAGLLVLNNGQRREGRFSEELYSFAVSKPAAAAAKAPLPAPVLSPAAVFKGRPLSWAKNASLKYYRLQLSPTSDFSAPILDAFTDKEAYDLSGLPLERDTTYYMRVMGSDGSVAGTWSDVSAITVQAPGTIAGDVRKPSRKK